MNRKIWTAGILCLFLAGCAGAPDLRKELRASLVRTNKDDPMPADTYTEYFKYYRGHSLGIYETTAAGAVFNTNGNRFAMNLNIDGIINKKEKVNLPSWSSVFPNRVYIQDTYVDSAGTIHYYKIAVKEAGSRYLTILTSDTVIFMAVSDEVCIPAMAAEMLRTARSVSVDEKKIRLAWSQDEQVNYMGQEMKLFENMTPENGLISEIMENRSQSAD